MPKRTLDHEKWLLAELQNPEAAARYLNAAFDDSPKMFLLALRQVAEARRMSVVAKRAKLSRENLYRTLSRNGNPRLDTLNGVLRVLGLEIAIRPKRRTR
jgi:probable addiction module antidote protein